MKLRFKEIQKETPKLEKFLIGRGDSISGKLQERVQELINELSHPDQFKENSYDEEFSMHIDWFLKSVLVIMKYNKKNLKKHLGIDDKLYREFISSYPESSIVSKIGEFNIKNYFIWNISESLHKNQRDYFPRP